MCVCFINIVTMLLLSMHFRVFCYFIIEERQILTRFIAKGIDINKFILLFTDCTETYCYLYRIFRVPDSMTVLAKFIYRGLFIFNLE